MDKVLYILKHLINKCRIQKRRLVSFTFTEHAPVTIVMEDIVTGEIIHEPAKASAVADLIPEPDEDDPLA